MKAATLAVLTALPSAAIATCLTHECMSRKANNGPGRWAHVGHDRTVTIRDPACRRILQRKEANGCLLTMNGICEACLQPHDFDCHYSITPVRIVQITCKALSLSLSLLSPLSSLLFSHFSPLSPYTTHARQPCSHPTRHHPLKEGNTWS